MIKLLTAVLIFSISLASSAQILHLNTSNTININSSISAQSVSQAISDIVELNNKRGLQSYPLYIVMNSPGGSIMAGEDLITFANTIRNIHTVCIFCASMAHAISQGIVGERLATLKNIMMAHRAKGTFSGQFENGELESQLQLFKKIVRTMEQRNANRIGISLKAYKSNVINEWWSYGSQSKKLNIVDKLVSLICSKELINKKRSSTRMTILGPMEGPEKSQCPLIP